MAEAVVRSPATPTLKELSNELATVENWHKLGVNLGLQGHQLRKLEQEYPRDSDRQKCEMLDIWLRNVQNPTWKVIVEALNLMQENVVADVIWRKYCCHSSTVPAVSKQESATHIHVYNVGFPVELLKEQWFHADITREIAEERLKCHANGCFLVRESETKRDCFSLSLKHPKGIAHYPIQRKDSGHYEVSGTHKSFETLPKLVDHFTQNPLSKDVYHQLYSPCPKPSYNFPRPNRLTSEKHTANFSKGKGSKNVEGTLPPVPPRDALPLVPSQITIPPPLPPKRRLTSGKHTATFKGTGFQNATGETHFGVTENDQTFMELLEACWNGQVELVRHLLMTGVNINSADSDGATPLIIACRNGHLPVVEHLIAAKADVNHQAKDGATPLYIACQEGHLPVVEYLIAAKADVNTPNEDGYSPLHSASQEGHDGIVERLLQAGATVDLQTKDGATPLFIACESGHLPVVESLIAAKADVNTPRKDGTTPLYFACQEGHLPVVEYLIAAKADVNTPRKDGATPLYIACQKGHLPVVEHLIAAKADVNTPRKNGRTPLMAASYNGHPSVVRVLLQAEATINTTEQSGETALHDAVNQEHEDVVDILLKAHIDPDVPDKESQETALMVAAKKGNVGVVKKLIKHGASLNLTNKNGCTAFDIASREGHMDVCQELLAHQFL